MLCFIPRLVPCIGVLCFARRVQLVGRVNALRHRQREGRGAPGTPVLFSKAKPVPKSTPFIPSSALKSPLSSQWTMYSDLDVPEFTPLARKIAGSWREPSLERPRLAAALLGRRYGTLVEEARRSEGVLEDRDGSDKSSTDVSIDSAAEASTVGEDTSVTSASIARLSPPLVSKPAPRPSLGGRVKGLLFSYLPTLSRKPALLKEHRPAAPGLALPLPPPEVLNRPRTVNTPGPKPVERAVAPTVHLRDVGVKEMKSRIPVMRREKPRRLVELRHVERQEADTSVSSASSGRRSSAGSVRDLREWFEEREKMVREETWRNLRRKQGV
ncbi:hypothetical protein NEOLEDRAFT_1137552 [Neolentinus lepideus HHB14362 ss-1]|uniref:Uncharacterized protein n=1 Tax=Neolentinus lepideus HHB14362 ss-1 TaxID=1314782 RepID=A0A165QR56_9AGAM|nr:hypothetical protein NEOLEDRAFT_1137552 [Neolentinus lepideus HHB14362 ss-1]